jgi:hypothetical protein
MDSNWGYVAAGYGLTTATLVVYTLWLRQRTRRVRRMLPDQSSD